MASCYCGNYDCEGEKCNNVAYTLTQAALKLKQLEQHVNALEQAELKMKELESKLKHSQERVTMFERMWI